MMSRRFDLSVPDGLKRLWPVVKVLIAAGLLVIIGLNIDWTRFFDLVTGVRPVWLVPVVLILLLDRAFMGGKWHYLLKGLGVRVGLFETVYQYYMASVIKEAVQWGPSGDIARAVAVGSKVGRHSVVAASVVLERLGGLAGTSAVASTALLILTGRYEVGQWRDPLLTLSVVTVAATVVGILAFWPPALRRMVTLGQKVPWSTLQEPMSRVREATDYLRGWPTGVVFLVLSFIEQVAPLGVLYLLSAAFDFGLSFLEILAVFPIIMFLGRLPFSLDAFGVQEALVVFLFSLVGVSTEVSFALSLSYRVMILLALAIGTGACLALKGRLSSEAEAGGSGPGSAAESSVPGS